MDPVIEYSVVKLTESSWRIGSSMICESDLVVPPTGALASWISDDGKTFYLQKLPESSQIDRTDPHGLTVKEIGELSQVDRVHKAGTSAAVWAFGNVHVKAKAWIPELQSESDTMKYVQTTSIPVPEVVFSWVDTPWNRSFLILKSLRGRTLYQAWETLSGNQRLQIADRVASYCSELALSTSQRMETFSGKGVCDDWLTKNASPLEPSWKPFVQGPFTVDQIKSYVRVASIAIGSDFHLYHADLGPTNILIDDNSHIVAVIDWESAAFYPRFWIATKPLFSAGFNLAGSERSAWAFLLSSALERRGFEAEPDLYRKWKAAVKG